MPRQKWDSETKASVVLQGLKGRPVADNLRQLGRRGLLNIDEHDIPLDARIKISELFQKVTAGESEAGELKKELDRWGLFEEYQDRFFSIFQKKR